MEGTWQLKSRKVLDAVVIKIATEFAEDMVVAFVTKVGMKLSGIVDRKGNLGKASIHGSLRDHWMTFEFRDGSTFQVQSQIVWKTSINGLHFRAVPDLLPQREARGRIETGAAERGQDEGEVRVSEFHLGSAGRVRCER
jgi:hypothetical protein